MKIKKEEAPRYLVAAGRVAGPNYRFGQALWNMLPTEVTFSHTATERDFFYTEDMDEVISLFTLFFVED